MGGYLFLTMKITT
jgi:hypothetical protein